MHHGGRPPGGQHGIKPRAVGDVALLQRAPHFTAAACPVRRSS